MQVRYEQLRNRERNSCDRDRRPYFDHPVPAGKCAHQPERHQNTKRGQNSSRHRAQRNLAETSDLGESDDRGAQCAEGYWRCVCDQRQAGSLQRSESEPDQQSRSHRHGRAEAGRALKECSKAEGDEEQLQATILRDAGQAVLQDVELSGFNRELVHKNNVQHDPADREEAVTGAVNRRRSGKTGWHMKDKDGGEQGRRQSGQRRVVRLYMSERETAEQHDNRQRGQDRGKPPVSGWVVTLCPRRGQRRNPQDKDGGNCRDDDYRCGSKEIRLRWGRWLDRRIDRRLGRHQRSCHRSPNRKPDLSHYGLPR